MDFRVRSGPLKQSQGCHGTRDRDHQAWPDRVVPAKSLSDSRKALFEIVDHLAEIRPGNLDYFDASREFRHGTWNEDAWHDDPDEDVLPWCSTETSLGFLPTIGEVTLAIGACEHQPRHRWRWQWQRVAGKWELRPHRAHRTGAEGRGPRQ